MLSFLRIGMTILGLTLILIGVGGVFGLSQSGRFVKETVETKLEAILSTEVEIAEMRVLPLRGAIELTGLEVMNPDPFKKGPALKCERIVIRLDPTTVFSKVRVIEELSLEGMEIRYRVKIGEGTNIGRLATAAEATGENEPSGFVVKSLRCEDAEVHLSTNAIPLTSAGMNLVSIHLKDLNGSRAVSAGALTSILLRSLLGEIITLNGLLDPIANPVKKGWKKLKEKLSRKNFSLIVNRWCAKILLTQLLGVMNDDTPQQFIALHPINLRFPSQKGSHIARQGYRHLHGFGSLLFGFFCSSFHFRPLFPVSPYSRISASENLTLKIVQP